MLGSYLLSAVRALGRDPWHAAVNVAGLALALCASLLIALYVRHELSYEDFVTQRDKVYRVEVTAAAPGAEPHHGVLTNYPLPELLNADFPDQLTAARLISPRAIGPMDVSVNGVRSRRDVTISDEQFFDVIDLPVLEGDAGAAMTAPDGLVLSKHMAGELFGAAPALGKTVTIFGKDLRVAAIVDPPANTQFQIDLLVSAKTVSFLLPPQVTQSWSNFLEEALVRVKGEATGEAVASQLPAFVARHKPAGDGSPSMSLSLRPLRELHLVEGDQYGELSNRNVTAVAALAATAAFLVFIACFSYVNLATARSLLRVREAGLRKVLGGRGRQLAFQFLVESLVVTALAFVLAFAASTVLLPAFATLVGRKLALADLADPAWLGAAAGLCALAGLAAGAYPALVLAGRKPAELFRGRQGEGGGLLRTGIVTVQFGLTAALMIAATAAFAQILYLRSIDMGFDTSGLLLIKLAPGQASSGQEQALVDELRKSPSIVDVAGAGDTPQASYEMYFGLSRPGDAPGPGRLVLDVGVGRHWFETYRIAPVAGRLFSDDLAVDRFNPQQPEPQASIILAESAVSYLGFASPQDAVGKVVTASLPQRVDFTVVGVVPDLQWRLAHLIEKPMVFLPPGGLPFGEVTARVRPGAAEAAVADARRIWAQALPGELMDYQFLEDRIEAASADDDRQSKLFGFFAGLALVVSCLGLFALASFVAARRTREIAVRKVVGATTLRVTRLLMWDFAKPVLLANVIAWPLAYAMVTPWLARFPYRIDLDPRLFLGVSALSLLVAMLTIATRTIAAARTRPAIVLRAE